MGCPMTLPAAGNGERLGCLFCRRTDGAFKSKEHIFAEGLGNHTKVLPPGVVCDRCNHEVCAPLDAALCDFGPIAFMRTFHGIPSKRGKLPSFQFDNGSFAATGPGELALQLDHAKWRSRDVVRPDGRTEWSFTAQRNEGTPKRLSLVHRALVKMVVECAWLDEGDDLLLSDVFDRERDIVMRGGHRGYLVIPKEGLPAPDISLEYMRRNRTSDGAALLFIETRFWGISIATDTLFPRPMNEVPPEYCLFEF
jgi:hypothetical protein